MGIVDNQLIQFFLALNEALQRLSLRYCLIGGFAAGFWAKPRYTQDIDFTISLAHDDMAILEKEIRKKFSLQRKGDDQFRIMQKGNTALTGDFIIARTDYQEWVIQRAEPIELFGIQVPMCTAEDLIILKLIAHRRQDLLDIENVLAIHYASLDMAYLKKWLVFWELEGLYQREFERNFPI